MYKIFDLHNDYFLQIQKDSKRESYVEKQEFAQNIISAIWTSELSEKESFSTLEKACHFVNNQEKLFLGVEDLHFLNKTNLIEFTKFN